MRITIKFIIAILLLAPLSVAEAASYYVDSTTGSDSNSGGSPTEAWRSLDKINRTTFQPGDRLLLKAGAAWTGRLHPKGSGNAAKDAKEILADPRLLLPGGGRLGLDSVAGYKLLAGSPALNAGLLIPANGGRDYWGNPVSDSATPHVGADNGSPAQSEKEQR